MMDPDSQSILGGPVYLCVQECYTMGIVLAQKYTSTSTCLILLCTLKSFQGREKEICAWNNLKETTSSETECLALINPYYAQQSQAHFPYPTRTEGTD